jgi:hypothetical protein
MTRYRLLSGPMVLAALLFAAPAAQADDASLFSAYAARQGQIDAASDVYIRAVKRNNRHPSAKRLRAIIAADRGINAALTAIKSDLAGQTASSRHGRKARAAAFREVRWWKRGNTSRSAGSRRSSGVTAATSGSGGRTTRCAAATSKAASRCGTSRPSG